MPERHEILQPPTRLGDIPTDVRRSIEEIAPSGREDLFQRFFGYAGQPPATDGFHMSVVEFVDDYRVVCGSSGPWAAMHRPTRTVIVYSWSDATWQMREVGQRAGDLPVVDNVYVYDGDSQNVRNAHIGRSGADLDDEMFPDDDSLDDVLVEARPEANTAQIPLSETVE
jgi:hypothetical protein